MLGQQKEPLVNAIVDVFALASTAVEVTDVDTANGTAVDMGVPKGRQEIVIVDILGVENLDDGFVTIQESVDQGVWSNVCIFQMSDGMQMKQIERKARYLRAVTRLEFEQPDEENPVDTTYLLSIKVLQ